MHIHELDSTETESDIKQATEIESILRAKTRPKFLNIVSCSVRILTLYNLYVVDEST